MTCEFADVDREIKTQIVQSYSSHKLRTKALENPSYTLTQLLDDRRAMDLSQKQAANIEESQTVNKLSSQGGYRNQQNWNAKAGTNKDSGHATDKKSHNRKSRRDGHEIQKSSDKCRNCGGD